MGELIGTVQGAEVSVEKDPHFCMWYVRVQFQDRFWRRSLSEYHSHINPAFQDPPILFKELKEAKASGRRVLREMRTNFKIIGPKWVEDRYRNKESKPVLYDPRPFRLGGYR